METKGLVFFVLLLAIISSAVSFNFGTYDGIYIQGDYQNLDYNLGYPKSEISFSLTKEPNLFKILTGYDFRMNSFYVIASYGIKLNEFYVYVPLTFSFREHKEDELSESGRINIGVGSEIYLSDLTFGILADYSFIYYYFDPAFGVSFPSFSTDEFLRTWLKLYLKYDFKDFNISLGYVSSMRWSPYFSGFLTKDNQFFLNIAFRLEGF